MCTINTIQIMKVLIKKHAQYVFERLHRMAIEIFK